MSNKSDIKLIENFLLGDGAKDFRALEAITNVFCPFEAVGMVRQEIRHAHFLAYILDPNRPHNFATAFLEEVIQLIVEVGQTEGHSGSLNRLDLFIADLSNVEIRRERHDIDLMFIIPKSGHAKKGYVFTIEMKVDAQEDPEQLRKYEKTALSEFPRNNWHHSFVFLTKEGVKADNKDGNEKWAPLPWGTVIAALENRAGLEHFEGPAADLLTAYIAMQRRHIVQDEKLEHLIAGIWRKHGDALDLLVEYRPDFQSDILTGFEGQIPSIIGILNRCLKNDDIIVAPETCLARYKRIAVSSWDKFPEAVRRADNWLNKQNNKGEPNRLSAIEVYFWGGNLVTSFIIGPGLLDDGRQEIFDAFTSKLNQSYFANTKPIKTAGRHMARKVLLSSEELKNFQINDTEAEDIFRQISNRFINHWKDSLPYLDGVLKALWSEQQTPSHPAKTPL